MKEPFNSTEMRLPIVIVAADLRRFGLYAV